MSAVSMVNYTKMIVCSILSWNRQKKMQFDWLCIHCDFVTDRESTIKEDMSVRVELRKRWSTALQLVQWHRLEQLCSSAAGSLQGSHLWAAIALKQSPPWQGSTMKHVESITIQWPVYIWVACWRVAVSLFSAQLSVERHRVFCLFCLLPAQVNKSKDCAGCNVKSSAVKFEVALSFAA